ncbi:MAG: hypothetical protein F4Z88_08645 [Chloroflexi bacterium]|nr:hypothetical protein [Chloroflexota bacterium]
MKKLPVLLVLLLAVLMPMTLLAAVTGVTFTTTTTSIEGTWTEDGTQVVSAQLQLNGEDVQDCRVLFRDASHDSGATASVEWTGLTSNVDYVVETYVGALNCSGAPARTDTVRTVASSPVDSTAFGGCTTRPYLKNTTTTLQRSTSASAGLCTVGSKAYHVRRFQPNDETAGYLVSASLVEDGTVDVWGLTGSTWSKLIAANLTVDASVDISQDYSAYDDLAVVVGGSGDYTITVDVPQAALDVAEFRIEGASVYYAVAGGTLLFAGVHVDGGASSVEDSPSGFIEDIRVHWKAGSRYLASAPLPRLYSLHASCGYTCDTPDGQGFNLVVAWVPDWTGDVPDELTAEITWDTTVEATRQGRSSDRPEEAGSYLLEQLQELGNLWAVNFVAGEGLTSEGLTVARTLLPQLRSLGLGLSAENIPIELVDDAGEPVPEGVDLPEVILKPLRDTAETLGVAITTIMLVFGVGLALGAWVLVARVANASTGLGVLTGGPLPIIIVSGLLGVYGYIALAIASIIAVARFIREHIPSG